MSLPDERAGNDPYVGANFTVELEFDSVIVAGFSEVSGIEMELETETYEEGGVNTHVHTLPKRYTYPNLVLRRGVTDSRKLVEWVQQGLYGTIQRKTVAVVLHDRDGMETWRWTFLDAYPVAWRGPELGAEDASIAIETLEITHDGLVVGD